MPETIPFSVLTSNASAEFLAPPGVPPWLERAPLYAQAIRDAAPTVIGLQEVMPRQGDFLRTQWPELTAVTLSPVNVDPALLPAWRAKYGRFGLDTLPDPYEVMLFFRTAECEALATGHWWLSPTPERPSTGFGNTAPRAVIWAQLRHRPSGREIVVFNTHLDHRCLPPMVEVCRQQLAPFLAAGTALVFMGDMNVNPATAEYARLLADGWRDAHAGSAEADTFLYDLPGIPGGRIDHIFYRGEALVPRQWARLASPDPTRRLSDHDPVLARFDLTPAKNQNPQSSF